MNVKKKEKAKETKVHQKESKAIQKYIPESTDETTEGDIDYDEELNCVPEQNPKKVQNVIQENSFPIIESELSIEKQMKLCPKIDSIISDPVVWSLTTNGLSWTTKECIDFHSSGVIIDDKIRFIKPDYVGRSIVCVKVPFDINPNMYIKKSNSKLMRTSLAFILHRSFEHKTLGSEELKIVCFVINESDFLFCTEKSQLE